jgi:cytosine/adenosine deaminase-related metal-dependent hydrolase
VAGRLLIRGGVVLTGDDRLGDVADGDILVEDGRIVDVGRGIEVADAEFVNAAGCVVIPGFVDTHRHTWQSVLRGLLPSCTLGDYFGRVMFGVGPRFRPEDVYAGTLLGSVEALNAGITTMVDWAHINNTPEHADAGIAALTDAGIRAMYAHGCPTLPEYLVNETSLGHPEDARRIRNQYFSSSEQLLTLALALRGPHIVSEVTRHDWNLARELGARITVHMGVAVKDSLLTHGILELRRDELLGADTTYIHCNCTTDDEFQMIRDSGGTVSVAPYVEMVMGHGRPPIGRLLKNGLRPSLSGDVVTTVPGDMFTQMRSVFAVGRIEHLSDDVDVPFDPSLTHRDVLRFATLDGAAACGLDHRIGSITPGKEADLVLIRADDVNTMPINDPAAVVVTSADTSNIDSVFVRGRAVKRDGRLVNVDLRRLHDLASASRDHVLGVDP